MTHDLPGAEDHCHAAMALARRWGIRSFEASAAHNLMYVLMMGGRFEEARRLGTEVLQSVAEATPSGLSIHSRLTTLEALRGDTAGAREHLTKCETLATSDAVQARAVHAVAESALALAEGRFRDALDAATRALDESLSGLEVAHEAVRMAFPYALDAAFGLDDPDEAERVVDLLAGRPSGEVPPFLRAQIRHARGLISSARSLDGAWEEDFLAAEQTCRDLNYPYWTARIQLDRAESLARQGRPDDAAAVAAKAAAAFEQMDTPAAFARARALTSLDVSVS